MTRHDSLACVHEPFGDAFYFGPERLSERYEKDEKERTASGFSSSTFKTILDRIEREGSEGKRLFIKDITHYLVPPHGKPASIAPSLVSRRKGVGTGNSQLTTNEHITNSVNGRDSTNGTNGHNPSADLLTNAPLSPNAVSVKGAPYPYPTAAEPNNPTVVPAAILQQFHFTFLIRHPRSSIPSYYRCTIPPLDEVTGFYDFMPSEAGYDELRRVFDYLRSVGHVGPKIAGQDFVHATNGDTAASAGPTTDGDAGKVEICVVDADDLLDNPAGIIKAYCQTVGIQYDEGMLNWDTEEDHRQAKDAFEKWKGFHEDAIDSSSLKPRLHKKKVKSHTDEDSEWREKFGDKGAKIIRETIDANIADYEYLKQFALKP
ncbi:MAG: hypothetical protein M1827_006109 [Pycnora praestabilis]|nr:MAG: hypothetical protein M1827_006109 [Pycnora praestabilis]